MRSMIYVEIYFRPKAYGSDVTSHLQFVLLYVFYVVWWRLGYVALEPSSNISEFYQCLYYW